MHKLLTINSSEQVLGKVIEFRGDCFQLNEYYVNEYGTYTYMVLCELDEYESTTLCLQYSGDARKRKLHGIFRNADYIDEDALD